MWIIFVQLSLIFFIKGFWINNPGLYVNNICKDVIKEYFISLPLHWIRQILSHYQGHVVTLRMLTNTSNTCQVISLKQLTSGSSCKSTPCISCVSQFSAKLTLKKCI